MSIRNPSIRRVGAVVVPLTVFLLAPFCSTLCEEPKRGRLPDGTAFRTDVTGSQLVDYIAELEVTVEELLRRVHGLENELDAAQAGGTSAVALPLQEKNLGPSDGAQALSKELSSCRASLSSCESLNRTVNASPTSDAALVELRTRLEEREVALAAREREIAELRGRTAAAPAVASPTATAVTNQAPAAVSVAHSRASVDLARLQALQATKGKLNTEFNKLQSSLRSRDALLAKYRSSPQPVQFQAARVDPRELTAISAGIAAASDGSELSRLGARMKELSRRVEADVGLMQRMLKSR